MSPPAAKGHTLFVHVCSTETHTPFCHIGWLSGAERGQQSPKARAFLQLQACMVRWAAHLLYGLGLPVFTFEMLTSMVSCWRNADIYFNLGVLNAEKEKWDQAKARSCWQNKDLQQPVDVVETSPWFNSANGLSTEASLSNKWSKWGSGKSTDMQGK